MKILSASNDRYKSLPGSFLSRETPFGQLQAAAPAERDRLLPGRRLRTSGRTLGARTT
jgi:hypothetical protein